MNIARLRLIAGPNGAGKSTLTTKVLIRHVNLSIYINPDEIVATLEGDDLSRVVKAQQMAVQQRERLLFKAQSMSYESARSHAHLDFL